MQQTFNGGVMHGRLQTSAAGRLGCRPHARQARAIVPPASASAGAAGPSSSGRTFDEAARRLHQAGKAATRRMEDAYVALGANVKQTAETANERFQLKHRAQQLGTQVQEQVSTWDRRSGFSRRLRNALTDLLRAAPVWQRSWRTLDPRVRISLQCGLIGICFFTGNIRLLAGILMTTWMVVAAGTGLFLLDAMHKTAASYDGRQSAFGGRRPGPGSFGASRGFPGGFPGGRSRPFPGGRGRGPAADAGSGPVIDVEHQSLD